MGVLVRPNSSFGKQLTRRGILPGRGFVQVLGPGGYLLPGSTFTRASTATDTPPPSTTLQSYTANVLRDGGTAGALIEGPATNVIRNSRQEGGTSGVLGSGGVVPTNGAIGNIPAGVTATIAVGLVEAGIPYWTLRLSGTNTSGATAFPFWQPETGNNFITASVGQVWTSSVYVGVAAGSLTGITSTTTRIGEYSTSGTVALTTGDLTITPAFSGLVANRWALTRTLANGAVTTITAPFVFWTIANGAAVDVTFKIAMPQVELSYYASSIALPPQGSPVAFTRALDNLTVTGTAFTSLFGAGAPQGCIICDVLLNQQAGAVSQAIAAIDDGTDTKRLILSNPAGSTLLALGSGATTVNPLLSIVPGTPFRVGMRWTTTTMSVCLNGATPVSATFALPVGINLLRIGNAASLLRSLNGRMLRVKTLSSAPVDAAFQAMCATVGG